MMKQVKFKFPVRIMAVVFGLFLSVGAFAQQIAVNGHVKDATGEPIIGATVLVVGGSANEGAVTDLDGNFTLNVNQGAKLRVSYIGYNTQEVTAAANVVITLEDDAAQNLNEVVVIGYGAVKKSDLTGAVTALKPDSKNKGLVVNAQDMIAGKIAGVSVTSDSGSPGGSSTIRIRGGASLNASNDPLIVIDGVAVEGGAKGMPNPLASINPQDIESFNVLKSASATAIYGSRGSNGVIIITTKKGHKGQKPSVSYAGSVTMSKKTKTIDVLDANEYRALVKNRFGEDSEEYSALGTANTDWQDLLFRTAWSHDHNVTVSGSVGSILPYRVSVGYTNQEGILKNSDFERVTGAINLNPSFFKDHLVLNLNAKGVYAKTLYGNDGAIGSAIGFDPTQDPHAFTSEYHKRQLGDNMSKTLNNYGGYFEWSTPGTYDPEWPFIFNGQAGQNPLAVLNGSRHTAHSREFVGSADIDYKVHGFEDLRLHATLGADISQGQEDYRTERWNPAGNSTSDPGFYTGYSGFNRELKRNLTLSTYAQYYHDFNDKAKNHVDLMVGYEWQHYFYKGKGDGYGTYPLTYTLNPDKAGQTTDHIPWVSPSENYLVSFFGRGNYSLMDRYYFTFTVRRDGTSRFGNHYSTFPSAAFAWRINDENCFRNVEWLSDLKLRLDWGMTGQQAFGDGYGWIPTYEMNLSNIHGLYPIVDANGDGVITPEDGKTQRPGNYTPELKWETTTTYNIGLDWGFWDQKLSGTIDWYHRRTTDLINYATTVAMTANRNMANQNIGSLVNMGVEAAIAWRVLRTKDWFWTVNYNFAYNYNKITELPDVTKDQPKENGSIGNLGSYVEYYQVGYPANAFWVYQQVYDQNGNPIEGQVVDRNGDGQISAADRYFYKSPAAPVTMGFSSRLEWKNFDFGFSLRASIGNYVFNNIESGHINTSASALNSGLNGLSLANVPTCAMTDQWQTWDVEAKLTDRFVHNASFLKCDNITLGYSFNNLLKMGNYRGLSGRVYGTVNNVFTITKYDGIDPEIGNGYDNTMYPRPISFILGLNLNF
ncbi:MAG: TonB-dependent receptor [Prevotella sp.]|nr:TonB-dependent receptor [Prevotella sp.]